MIDFDPNKKHGLIENLIMVFLGYKTISWSIRDALNECNSYSCAYKMFN
jgi:hypothetical protein